jgi:hypothetical protein
MIEESFEPDFTLKLKDPSLLCPATLAVTADETGQTIQIEGEQPEECMEAKADF